jgi:hypothetical protein
VYGNILAVQNLTALTVLALEFTGVEGDLSGVKGLTSLIQLHMANVNVHGDLDAVAGLVKLCQLNIVNTSVSSHGLEGVSFLTALETCNLSHNVFGSSEAGLDLSLLPDSLRSLDINHNNFTGQWIWTRRAGDSICDCTSRLAVLDISGNHRHLTGGLPVELMDLDERFAGNVLNVRKGLLSPYWCSLVTLRAVGCGMNETLDSVLQTLSTIAQRSFLDLLDNQLSGTFLLQDGKMIYRSFNFVYADRLSLNYYFNHIGLRSLTSLLLAGNPLATWLGESAYTYRPSMGLPSSFIILDLSNC